MPPGTMSRFQLCQAITLPDGRVMLTDREPFGFVDRTDNARYVVGAGMTLWSIAAHHFRGSFQRPADLWWVIADFQPVPIFDPTRELEAGITIHAPSARTVLEEIFHESRRVDFL